MFNFFSNLNDVARSRTPFAEEIHIYGNVLGIKDRFIFSFPLFNWDVNYAYDGETCVFKKEKIDQFNNEKYLRLHNIGINALTMIFNNADFLEKRRVFVVSEALKAMKRHLHISTNLNKNEKFEFMKFIEAFEKDDVTGHYLKLYRELL